MNDPGAYPLVGRPPDAVLFHTAEGPVTARMFVGQAQALAARLRGSHAIINLCQDRLLFSLVLAASVLNDAVCWLVNDRSAGSLRLLKVRQKDALVVADGDIPPLQPMMDAENPSIPADRVVAMVFTSGSTGEPSGHRKNWGTLAERSITAGNRFGLSEDRPATILGTVPPQHMYGFETTVMQPWHAPCATWCGDTFYPADIQAGLHAIAEPRWLITTPLQLRSLVRAEAALPPLRAILSATAPMDPDLARSAEARWNTEVLEIFGATECGSIATRRTSAGDAWQLYPGIVFERANGTVNVRTPHAEDCPIADDIDLAADGQHFRLLGRKGDLIKIGGKRASLAGLNRILNSLAEVEDGVFVPPETDGDPVRERMIVVVQAKGQSPETILALLRERIDPVFLPRKVLMVDKMPRNETGKLPRKALEDLLAQSR